MLPRRSRLLLASVLLSALCFAQSQAPAPAKPSVQRGFVRDSVTGQPIAGARVTFVEGRLFEYNKQYPDAPQATTGPDGGFAITVSKRGLYMVNAAAPGYELRNPLNKSLPGPDFTIDMLQLATLEGRIVDAETDKPIAGITVSAVSFYYARGNLLIRFATDGPGRAPSVSGPDGVFRLSKLLPGTYIFRIEDEREHPTVTAGLGPDDAPPPAAGIGRQWWPGGSSPSVTGAITVVPGGTYSLPDFRIAKIPLLRISGNLAPDVCEPGDRYSVNLDEVGDAGLGLSNLISITGLRDLPCGERYFFDRVSPGNYNLVAQSPESAAKPRSAVEAFTLIQDAKLDIHPQPELQLDVRLQLPEEFSAAKGQPPVMIEARPLRGLATNGNFRIPSTPSSTPIKVDGQRPLQITVSNLPAPFYVKEIHYAGSPIAGNVLTPEPYSPDQGVKIVVARDGASIAGQVRDGDKAAPNVQVLLIPWPLRDIGGFPDNTLATTDTEGKYRFPVVAPGQYRLLSVTADALGTDLQKPGVLAVLAQGGYDAEAGAGMQITADLKLRH